MTENSKHLERSDNNQQEKRTLKSLVNTPLKKIMFGIQILSYLLIAGSPAIGGVVGKMFGLKATQIAGIIFGVFIAGEFLFYGSLLFLGKELLLLIRDRFNHWVSRVRSSRIK